jgi:transcriptional regulator with XRE-family HTH domain
MAQNTLASELRVLRARHGLTLGEAAKRIGIGPDTLSNLERGRKYPLLLTLNKIAAGYGVPVEELLELESPAEAAAGKGKASTGTGRADNELADLLRRAGAPTQHLADPGLVDRLDAMDDAAFYATVSDLDEEIEALAAEIRELRMAAAPGTPSYVKVMRLWDRTAYLFLALKMLVRAREGVEPQEEQLREVADISREIGELVGAVS